MKGYLLVKQNLNLGIYKENETARVLEDEKRRPIFFNDRSIKVYPSVFSKLSCKQKMQAQKSLKEYKVRNSCENLINRIKEVDAEKGERLNKKFNSMKSLEKLEEFEGALKYTLSELAGERLTKNNPDITDLSDSDRPMKLGERFSELYDNEWTDAFEALDRSGKAEKSIINKLRDCVFEAEKISAQIEDKPEVIEKEGIKLVCRLFGKSHSNDEKLCAYAKKSLSILVKAKNQSPPIVLMPVAKPGSQMDAGYYRDYTQSGKITDYVVWPAMQLYKDGPLLCKGVAQPLKQKVRSKRSLLPEKQSAKTTNPAQLVKNQNPEIYHEFEINLKRLKNLDPHSVDSFKSIADFEQELSNVNNKNQLVFLLNSLKAALKEIDVKRQHEVTSGFSELYDDLWTDTHEMLVGSGKTEREAIALLRDLMFCAEENIENNAGVTSIEVLNDFAKKQKDTVDKQMLLPYLNKAMPILKKAKTLTPVIKLTQLPESKSEMDKSMYKGYTRSGNIIDFVVWPSLHREDEIISKGVAEAVAVDNKKKEVKVTGLYKECKETIDRIIVLDPKRKDGLNERLIKSNGKGYLGNFKKELLNELSQLMGERLRKGNPNITDLSDPDRPMKLGERFSELYNNEWSDAFEALERSGKDEKSIINKLRDFVFEAEKISGRIEDKPEIIGKEAVKLAHTLFGKSHADDEDLRTYIREALSILVKAKNHSPPVVLKPMAKPGSQMDLNSYKPYTQTGTTVEYDVWPAMLLYKDGPLLCKGVAQPVKAGVEEDIKEKLNLFVNNKLDISAAYQWLKNQDLLVLRLIQKNFDQYTRNSEIDNAPALKRAVDEVVAQMNRAKPFVHSTQRNRVDPTWL
ncbi:hypothetical protein [Endozoicomonas sp. Mp262]|uniref:hypothetical protein n=1 Tax=Endozoicomonas sp. Mp262 TaxID=2919499 RepID=UPI0021D81E3D